MIRRLCIEGPTDFMECPVGRCMHAMTQPCHILLRLVDTTIADLCKASASYTALVL
jgi:hypothetical protein